MVAMVMISYKGLSLGEGGDFEALHCQPSTSFDRSTIPHVRDYLSTVPPIS